MKEEREREMESGGERQGEGGGREKERERKKEEERREGGWERGRQEEEKKESQAVHTLAKRGLFTNPLLIHSQNMCLLLFFQKWEYISADPVTLFILSPVWTNFPYQSQERVWQ
jgi:hypothetical protein